MSPNTVLYNLVHPFTWGFAYTTHKLEDDHFNTYPSIIANYEDYTLIVL